MRYFVTLTASAIAMAQSFASQPGGRLGWEDVILDAPHLSAQGFLSPLQTTDCAAYGAPDTNPGDLRCQRPFPVQPIDAEGSVYFTTTTLTTRQLGTTTIWRTRRDTVTEAVAHIGNRPAPDGSYDSAGFMGFFIDPIHGELYVSLFTACVPAPGSSCSYDSRVSVFRISGFATIKEVLPTLHRGGRVGAR